MPGPGRKLWSVSSVLSPRLLLFSNSLGIPRQQMPKSRGSCPARGFPPRCGMTIYGPSSFRRTARLEAREPVFAGPAGFQITVVRSYGATQQIAGRANRAQPQQRASNTAASEAPVNVGTARRWADRQRRLQLRPIGAGCVVWHQIQL
jgi:hypothetical protein